MASHSSTLAWRIPWTEEPARWHSMGRKEMDMTKAAWHKAWCELRTLGGDAVSVQVHQLYKCIIWWGMLTLGEARASLVAQRLKPLPAMQETWVRSLGWEDPLEKGMATHSSILVWRIPWTEEPGGLQSTGSQRWSDTTKRLHFHFQRWKRHFMKELDSVCIGRKYTPKDNHF